MSTLSNVWAGRFEQLLCREALKLATEFYPEPLTGLGRLPVVLAVEKVKQSLRLIFYPSEQCLDFLEDWVGRAYAHAMLTYSDPVAFCAAIHSQTPLLPEWSDISILSGLAGVGKSALSDAFQRAMKLDSLIKTPDGTAWPLQSTWQVKFRDIKTENGFWQRLGSTYTATHDNVSFCRRMAYRLGISFLCLDELQFFTLSREANTNLTRLMMAACNLVLPINAVGNYSLIRRLKKRESPDQQRLLNDPKFMMPDDPEGRDWEGFMSCQKIALPEILAIDPINDGPRMNLLSGEKKRAEVRLLTIAYEKKRKVSSNPDVKIFLADFENAYKSSEFQVFREEIEEISRRIIMNVTKEDDLSCPIELPDTLLQQFKRRAEQERNSRVACRELEDSLSAEEKQRLKEASKPTPKPRASATVRSINPKKAPKPTLADLARNSAMFSENI